MQNTMNAASACGVYCKRNLSKVGQHKLFVVAKAPCKESITTSLLASTARITEPIIFCGPDGMVVCKKNISALTLHFRRSSPIAKETSSYFSVDNSELRAALRRLHVGSVRSFLPILSRLTTIKLSVGAANQ